MTVIGHLTQRSIQSSSGFETYQTSGGSNGSRLPISLLRTNTYLFHFEIMKCIHTNNNNNKKKNKRQHSVDQGCFPFRRKFWVQPVKMQLNARIYWRFSGTNGRPSEVLHFIRSICTIFPFLLLALHTCLYNNYALWTQNSFTLY